MQDESRILKESRSYSYIKTTNSVEVSVEPEFVPDQSDTRGAVFAFSYRVRLRNLNAFSVQLINRHWRVFSGNQQIADVKGEGVIGLQPVIPPLESFDYQSWTVIHDAVGSMEGVYTMLGEDGRFFDIEIPRFELFYVNRDTLH